MPSLTALQNEATPLTDVPARDGGTRADPIVYIAGGPGVSAVSRAETLRIFSAANTSRDIVLVDQRGAGGSNPLTCSPPRTPPKTIAAIREYAEACLASLDTDPRQYTTAPAMDDLADVLVALGYGQVNVYGFSYGATAAA